MSYSLRTNWELKTWQNHLSAIYNNVNKQRNVLETFARVTEMATGISRGVREEDTNILKKFMPRFLAWLLGLSSQMEIDFEEAVWASYPGVCPYCRKSVSCSCKLDKDVKNRIRDLDEIKKFQNTFPKPTNLVEWVSMFGRIYEDINNNSGKMKMIGHFLEELGEVCEIIRFSMVPNDKLITWKIPFSRDEIDLLVKQEFSDLFAWYCGLVNKMSVDIDSDMKIIYGSLCPECSQQICNCDPTKVHKKLRLGAKKG